MELYTDKLGIYDLAKFNMSMLRLFLAFKPEKYRSS
jgi:hypothetical protein